MLPDAVFARINAHLDSLPLHPAGECRWSYVTGVGYVQDVQPAGHGDVTLRFTDGTQMTVEHDELLRVGPRSPVETTLMVLDAASSIFYARRRTGRVAYHLGPFAVYCWRRPLRVKFGWVGFGRFRI